MRTRSTSISMCLFLLAQAQVPLSLDSSFRTEIDTWYVSSVLPLTDGSLLASGVMRFPGELSDKRLVRLSADGHRDNSYNNSGLGQGKLTQWNSGLFYVGTAQTVRRILPSGFLDPGWTEMNLGPYFSSLQGGDYHVYPDGRLLMSGVHQLSDTARGFEGLYSLIWLSNTRYLDTTKTHRYCDGSIDYFKELPDGKFICSGGLTTYEGQPVNRVFRVQADGALDPTFNEIGRAHV